MADNNYSANLKSYGTHVLYFLKHIALHGIVAQSFQQLKKGFCLDGNNIPDARAKKKQRSSDTGKVERQLKQCNEQMSRMNQTALQKRIDSMRTEALEMRRVIRKMRKDGEPVDEIKEEEDALVDMNKELDKAKKDLDQMAQVHQMLFQQADDEGRQSQEESWARYEQDHVG